MFLEVWGERLHIRADEYSQFPGADNFIFNRLYVAHFIRLNSEYRSIQSPRKGNDGHQKKGKRG